MFIELDLFSGRPNPRWELGAADSERLLTLIAGLKASSDVTPEPPGLGYRGFRCTDPGIAYHVYGARVRGRGLLLADPSRTVERFLRDHVPPELDLRSAIPD